MTELANGPVPDNVPVNVTVATVVDEWVVTVAYLNVPPSSIVSTRPTSEDVPRSEAALIVIVTPDPLNALNEAVAEDAGVFPMMNTPSSYI
jgi:hypothetical protein